MIKRALLTATAFVALSAPALAASQVWNVTEESSSGIKKDQGKWSLNVDGGKISGTADMQLDNGDTLTYKLEGSVEDAVYKVSMSDRTDGQAGCVWTGHSPAKVDAKSHGLIGEVLCNGKPGFVVRAGF